MLVVLPAYNEATVIKDVLLDLKQHGYHKILVINDGSTDNTAEVVKEQQVDIITLPINCGVGAAFRAGLLFARRNNVDQLVFMDADGQHYPSDIKVLMDCAQENKANIVLGSRFIADQGSDIPRRRVFYNKLANWLTHFGQSDLTDSQTGFRLLDKEAINRLELECSDYAVCSEMIWKAKKANLSMAEAAIKVKYTDYSMSKGQNFWKGIRTGYSLISKW